MLTDKEYVTQKKRYSTPNVEIEIFSCNDVITTSGEVGAKWDWVDVFDNPFE